ncbi:MAG: response regulator [Cyclobacteriaceae bacterium]|nr:response regulator [Cyclobacteriaceae bacterium]
MMRSSKPIMLVDDDDIDFITLKRALKELNIKNYVVRSVNGKEALDYLSNPDNEMPCLILLDINMPVMNGLEFLRNRIKNEMIRSIPTIVLTTSKNDFDKSEAFRLSVAGYVVKPVDYHKFKDTLKVIDSYWTMCEFVAD